MATVYTHQSSNVAKTYLLMGLFLAVVGGLGYFVSAYYGNPGIFYIAIIFSVVMNVASFWWSDKIVLGMSKAKPAKREEFFDLYTVTENLSISAGLPMPAIYVIDDPAPNAFATGRNKEHAVVAVTTGLLSILDKNELEGVIAHEMSHIKNRDMLVMTVAVVLAGFIAIIADMFIRMSFFGGGNRDNDSKAGVIMLVLGIVAAILAPIAAQLIKMAFSRKREFLADASGALLTRYPEGLASALQKISSYGAPMRNANTATAHLFISTPFRKEHGIVSKLFLTHPPLEERIKRLEEM